MFVWIVACSAAIRQRSEVSLDARAISAILPVNQIHHTKDKMNPTMPIRRTNTESIVVSQILSRFLSDERQRFRRRSGENLAVSITATGFDLFISCVDLTAIFGNSRFIGAHDFQEIGN